MADDIRQMDPNLADEQLPVAKFRQDCPRPHLCGLILTRDRTSKCVEGEGGLTWVHGLWDRMEHLAADLSATSRPSNFPEALPRIVPSTQ